MLNMSLNISLTSCWSEDNSPILHRNGWNVEEKLKVDRKKFEALIEGNDPDLGTADSFFGNIMSEFPSLVIQWPAKLKPGTKSKKDPHVKLCGFPLMVRAARLKILDTLDATKDRVTLKMDVDWTAHSHVIGKAGASIQKVMDSTGCHVHFPDANRNSTNEKSNQVSIAGTALGVTKARIGIRDLLPIIVSFNLIVGCGSRSSFLDRLNHVIQTVEKLFMIQITVRFNAITGAPFESSVITILVRGIYGRNSYLKLAIDLFREFLADLCTKDNVIYQMNTEISCQHHKFVMGSDKSNLKLIMQTTGAIITFPDWAQDYDSADELFSRLSISPQRPQRVVNRKSSVNIKASTVDSLILALEMIQLSLPLSLTFDLKEGQEVGMDLIEGLISQWKVDISVKPKPKQNTKTIWIKGPEKDEWKLFEVRRLMAQHQNMTHSLKTTISSIWANDTVVSPVSPWLTHLNNDSDYESPKDKSFDKAPGAGRACDTSF